MTSLEEGSAHLLDLNTFWDDEAFAKEYEDAPLTQDMVDEVEAKLGYKLPQAYIDLCKVRNGGAPCKTEIRIPGIRWCFSVHSIFGIGSKQGSLIGEFGNAFLMEEWGYPEDIGIYFADTGSAGHDMFCLDYRTCGPQGEPSVVHVDQEGGYEVRFIARDFTTFLLALQHIDEVEKDDADAGGSNSWCLIL